MFVPGSFREPLSQTHSLSFSLYIYIINKKILAGLTWHGSCVGTRNTARGPGLRTCRSSSDLVREKWGLRRRNLTMEGYREGRYCTRNTYPESYSTKYTSIPSECSLVNLMIVHVHFWVRVSEFADRHQTYRGTSLIRKNAPP